LEIIIILKVAPGVTEIYCKSGLTIYAGSRNKTTRLECTIDGLIFSNSVIIKYEDRVMNVLMEIN
jgi:hypothetical protein